MGRVRAALLGVIAFASSVTLGVASAEDRPARTPDPAAGARLFETKGCVRCHAINGSGGKDGPDLGRTERPRSLYEVAAAMWNHLPGMAPGIRTSLAARPYMTSAEMSDLITFLYAPTSLGERPPDPSGDPRRGRQLVADKGCLGCHSLSGPGGKAAGNLSSLKGVDSPWTVIATMWNHSFLMELKSQEEKAAAWPRLSPDELRDLVAFLRAHAYGRDRDR
jgi:mono/diheme cytochrome c family protein